MIEDYNAGSGQRLRYIMRVIAARIMMKGFIYTDYLPEMAEFYREMGGSLRRRRGGGRETVREGIEAALQAFLDLFSGGNTGKMLRAGSDGGSASPRGAPLRAWRPRLLVLEIRHLLQRREQPQGDEGTTASTTATS